MGKIEFSKFWYSNENKFWLFFIGFEGVLAQEIREILPEAVVQTNDITLSNGEVVENFLHVDKGRLHMECVGAVIALDDKTRHLDKKIDFLENRIPTFTEGSSTSNKMKTNKSKLAKL